MRISELYGAMVVDEDGTAVGEVSDVRLRVSKRSRKRVGRISVAGLVVAPKEVLARAAHAWGYAEGRAQGPALLRWLTASAVRRSRFVPAGAIREWDKPTIRISGSAKDLESLEERRSR
jgi:hypothetical protein